MPIVCIDSRFVYFAHVPKCAGTAVEDYLAERFGPLGFLDRKHLDLPRAQRWSETSPQHIDAATLNRLMPTSFFSALFAVVRHPVDRVASVFRFQRDIERLIPEDMDFGHWLSDLADRRLKEPFYLDNHIRPASELVPERARVFRLEDGLEQVVAWLDGLAGNQDGPREVKERNTYPERLKRAELTAGKPPEISNPEYRLIEGIFETDFQRFGYSVETMSV